MGVKFTFFKIGNTIETLEEKDAELDKSGRYRKTMRWEVYLDVVRGDKEAIAQVDARMDMGKGRIFRKICNRQVEIDATRWRFFSSKQDTYGTIPISFTITGVGGTRLHIDYDVRYRNFESNIYHFVEPEVPIKVPAILPNPMSKELAFRFELQQDDSASSTCSSNEHPIPTSVFRSLDLFGDAGIQSSHETFEKFHSKTYLVKVQVDIPRHSRLEKLVKICQNVIKYEFALDSVLEQLEVMVQKGRIRYKSNRNTVPGSSNKSKHDRLGACQSIDELRECMHQGDPMGTYKFQILSSGESVEILLGPIFCEKDTMDALLRFCVLFVGNTCRFQAPKNCKSSTTIAQQIDLLFKHVIKDSFVEHQIRGHYILGDVRTFDHSLVDLSRSLANTIIGSAEGMSLLEKPDWDEMIEGLDCVSVSKASTEAVKVISSPPRKRPRNADLEQSKETSPLDKIAPESSATRRTSPGSSPGTSHDWLLVESDVKSEASHKHLWLRLVQDPNVKIGTARELQAVLKRLNMSVGNQLSARRKLLLSYMSAREKELASFFESQRSEDPTCEEKANVGMELVRKDLQCSNVVTLYLLRGQKLSRKVGRVHIEIPSPAPELQCVDTELEEILKALEFLKVEVRRPEDLYSCVQQLDEYILQAAKNYPPPATESGVGMTTTRYLMIHDISGKGDVK